MLWIKRLPILCLWYKFTLYLNWVYFFFLSVKYNLSTYIGSIICINEHLPHNNKGYDFPEECPEKLHPYGFQVIFVVLIWGTKLFVSIWKEDKKYCDYYIHLGNRDPCVWVNDAGIMIINQVGESGRYLFSENDLN